MKKLKKIRIRSWVLDLSSWLVWFNAVVVSSFMYLMQDPGFLTLVHNYPGVEKVLLGIYGLVNLLGRSPVQKAQEDDSGPEPPNV